MRITDAVLARAGNATNLIHQIFEQGWNYHLINGEILSFTTLKCGNYVKIPP